MKELAAPGILNPYYARVNARRGSTSLFSLAPNPLFNRLADLPIKVPFLSIIGNRGRVDGPNSSDGVVGYRSSHLEGAGSEKIIPAGHDLLSHQATVAEIKRILYRNDKACSGLPERAENLEASGRVIASASGTVDANHQLPPSTLGFRGEEIGHLVEDGL